MENTTLITGKKYVKDIFAADQFYNVPDYQRPYVWGEEQIQALLGDISKAMETDDKKEYFLGCMIWNTRKAVDGNKVEYECQDILDGQQRFITTLLLYSVIRDLSDDDNLKKDVQENLVQKANVFKNIPARNRIDFEIRDDQTFLNAHVINNKGMVDQEELKRIVNDQKGYNYSIRNMAKGILTMHKWWSDKLSEKQANISDYLTRFYIYLSNKVLALYLATPNNVDDAYNLFTVLNSRGLQLQVSDILRAQNLREITNEITRKEYAEKWADYENSVGVPFKEFDEFLWALVHIKMKYRSDDTKSLTKAFEYMFSKKTLVKGELTIDFVGKYIRHYEAITNGSIISKESQQLFVNLNHILSSVFGSQYMTPLLHYKECFGDYRIVDFLVKIDNLLSASWLLGRRQSITRIFFLLKRMEYYVEKIPNEKITKEKAADLFLGDTALQYDFYDESMPSDQPIHLNDFFMELDTAKWGSFSGSKINKTRYLLLKLDLLLGNAGTLLQYNKDLSSIEHLMPQNITKTKWNIDESSHREWVHRLGNIVMIDRNKNASLSNKIFAEKRVKYEGYIETRANTNSIFIKYSEWTIPTLIENHARVVALLKNYYSGNSLEKFLEIKRSQPQKS